jgi:hypothetical protein
MHRTPSDPLPASGTRRLAPSTHHWANQGNPKSVPGLTAIIEVPLELFVSPKCQEPKSPARGNAQTAKPSAVRSQRLCLVPHTYRFLGRQSLGCRAGTGTRPHPSVQRGAPKPDRGKIIARVTAFLRLRALRSFGGCHARRTWMCFLGNARDICCRDGLTVWRPFADDTRASTFEDASKSLSNWGARREAKTSRRGFL